jgi:hypothetical protein
MTPTTAELLAGNMLVLSNPPPPESAGEYAGGMIGVTGMISVLAAQEAERGAAVRVAENAAIRTVLARAGVTVEVEQGQLTISALDADNAVLRRALIEVHEAAEVAADTEREREILALYRVMAAGRRLELPSMPGL